MLQRDEWFSMTAPLQSNSAAEVVEWGVSQFGESLVYPCSFGVEGIVLLHMLSKCAGQVKVVTVDTGRLPEETHELIQVVRATYELDIEILFPEASELARLVHEAGPNMFYNGSEERMKCCQVRRVAPLNRALGGARVWMSGLRREQGGERRSLARFEWDTERGIPKLLPIVDWTWDEVWTYVHRHEVPYNTLHDRGYPSIGCAPCTRPMPPGVDPRAGRWWWEVGAPKECGLHLRSAGKRDSNRGRVA